MYKSIIIIIIIIIILVDQMRGQVIILNWAVEQLNKYALSMFTFLSYSVK